MKTRRGTFTASDLKSVLRRFEVGDIVTSVITGSVDFIGTVVDIDEKICKAFVDWGDGGRVQHDPDEIQHVPTYIIEKMEREAKASTRRSSLSASVVEEISDFPEGVARIADERGEDPQYVGNPKTHGMDKPVGGGFSIMQNLQKKLAPEALQESKEGPKIAPQQAEGGEDDPEGASTDQNAPGGDQNAHQTACENRRGRFVAADKGKGRFYIEFYKNGRRNRRYWPTLEEAKEVAEKIFKQTGIVVGIEEDKSRKSSERVSRVPQEGDEIRYVGDDGAVTIDRVYDVFGKDVETEYEVVIDKKYLRWRGSYWEVRGRLASRDAEMASDGELRSRRAMYWSEPGRVYRLTKQEQNGGAALCPKCKQEMEKQRFTRSDKLLSCPGCGFKIPTSKTVTERKVEVELEPDGTIEVEIEPVENGEESAEMTASRRGRIAAVEVPPNLSSMSISEIAALISADWKRVNYAAKPYLEAMFSLRSVKDNYFMDSGTSIVAYFLSNASSWRGEVAKAVKKELKKRIR